MGATASSRVRGAAATALLRGWAFTLRTLGTACVAWPRCTSSTSGLPGLMALVGSAPPGFLRVGLQPRPTATVCCYQPQALFDLLNGKHCVVSARRVGGQSSRNSLPRAMKHSCGAAFLETRCAPRLQPLMRRARTLCVWGCVARGSAACASQRNKYGACLSRGCGVSSSGGGESKLRCGKTLHQNTTSASLCECTFAAWIADMRR